MRDRQTEALYYPQGFLSPHDIGTTLCVAPHPDDEVFGAGGLLALMAADSRRVDVLVMSRGERATGEPSDALALQRLEESRRAADVLGLRAPRFLDWPDRGMQYGEPLIDSIASVIEELQPEVLLLPALSEPHPDHQAVALAGVAAVQRSTCVRSVLFYEVGAPMHPNALVDISSVAERKWQAMREFVSQEEIQPYENQARALAVLRSFGRGPACAAAEAFFRVEVDILRQQGAAAALPMWPMARMHQRLANSPEQLPLVSVLVRSMNRPQLVEAIASVAAQTYSHLEVVVVNASGRVHAPVLYPHDRMSLRMIQPGRDPGCDPETCDRARAANLALHAAVGQLALFLDEDDLIHPGHIERLVDALDQDAKAVAAYAGVRVEGPDGEFVRNYDSPWSPQRLEAINFLPIHAVLFRLDQAKAARLGFDETLPALEDWQFWRELSELGSFVHCPGVSALYRQAHGHSGIGDPEHPNYWRAWHQRLLERSVARKTVAENARLLAWHAIELDQMQSRFEALGKALAEEQRVSHRQRDESQAELARTRSDLTAAQAGAAALSSRLLTVQGSNDQLQHDLQRMLRSHSWRLTKPLRAVNAWLRSRRA